MALRKAVRLRSLQALLLSIPVSVSLLASAGEKTENTRMYASELLGAAITDTAGRDIGRVKDLIVHLDSNAVGYVAVTLTGLQGVPRERVYALPLKELQPGKRDDELLFDGNARRVAQLRSWDREKWTRIPALVWAHQGQDVSGASAGSGVFGVPELAPTFRATKLLGTEVEALEGESLGALNDLVIDLSSQTVRYAVVDFDPGILAAGRRQIFSLHRFALTRPSTGGDVDKLVLNLDSERLKALRGFTGRPGPDRTDAITPPAANP